MAGKTRKGDNRPLYFGVIAAPWSYPYYLPKERDAGSSANRLKIIFYFYYWQTVCSDNLMDSTQTPEAKAILRNLDLREGLAGAEIADVRKMHRLRIGAYFKMTETGQEGCIPCAQMLGAEACPSLIKSRNFGCLPHILLTCNF